VRNSWQRIAQFLLLLGWCGIGHVAIATDTPPPTFRTFAGTFYLKNSEHDYFVESEFVLPLMREGAFGVDYRYRETTPFLALGEPQAELLYSRFELEGALKLSPHLRLIGVAGYHQRHTIDRHGIVGGQVLGIGIGSPPESGAEWIEWYAIAGEYLTKQKPPGQLVERCPRFAAIVAMGLDSVSAVTVSTNDHAEC